MPIKVRRWSAAVPSWPRCFSHASPYPVMWGHFASPVSWPTQQSRPRILKVPEAITRARRRWTKSVSISVIFLTTLLVPSGRARVMASGTFEVCGLDCRVDGDFPQTKCPHMPRCCRRTGCHDGCRSVSTNCTIEEVSIGRAVVAAL